jgi:O-methyltransferase
MSLRSRAQLLAKKALAPILYRHRPIGLSAGKLYLYLDALYRTNHLKGAILEVGCNVCGTSALGHQMLRKLKSTRPYVCIDTFSGFVDAQHDADVALGNPGDKAEAFSANDIALARRILALHEADSVELIQADICALPDERLPAAISVSLLDVDLYEPILAGLEKVWPRLEPGGSILVDDCNPAGTWKAGRALEEFARKVGVTPHMEFGMGVLTRAG